MKNKLTKSDWEQIINEFSINIFPIEYEYHLDGLNEAGKPIDPSKTTVVTRAPYNSCLLNFVFNDKELVNYYISDISDSTSNQTPLLNEKLNANKAKIIRLINTAYVKTAIQKAHSSKYTYEVCSYYRRKFSEQANIALSLSGKEKESAIIIFEGYQDIINYIQGIDEQELI